MRLMYKTFQTSPNKRYMLFRLGVRYQVKNFTGKFDKKADLCYNL